MSNEHHEIEVNEEKHHCLCHSKWFKKFLTTALGTFVGVYFALCLFSAIHKPPMPFHCPCGCGCPAIKAAMAIPHYFYHGSGKSFHKRMSGDNFEHKAPVKIEIDD